MQYNYKLEADYEGFVELIDFAKKLMHGQYQKLNIDISSIQFIHTAQIVILSCVIELLYLKGITVEVININKKVDKHFKNIKFYQYWSNGFNRNNYTNVENKTTLCLWKISKEMIYQYVNYAQTHFENIFLKGKDLQALNTNLSEVFNNIFDHSESEITGFAITQFFPKKDKISIAVCDFGVGIANRINKFRLENNQDKLEDIDAILMSLEKGYTTKSKPRNMGLGLNTVISIVESFEGSIQIIANNGWYFRTFGNIKQEKNVILNKGFSGTLILISLRASMFDEKEDNIIEIQDL